MAKKVYRSAQGKSIDLGALQLQNETVRAVGNMGVNARGDIVNAQNTTVESKNQSVNRQYKKQLLSNVTDNMPPISKKTKKSVVEHETSTTEVKESEVIEANEANIAKPIPKENTELKGLAGAIAKAKSVKQEPIKTPRQIAQEESGVKKI